MSINRYNSGSLIDEITFKRSDNGSVRAYIHAREDIGSDELMNISRSLSDHDWQCIPSVCNGRPVLEVRGFGREGKLTDALAEHSWLTGSPSVQQMPEDKQSFTDKLKHRTLQASGLAYLLGDACYMKYGQKKSCWEEVLAGLLYFGGTATVLGWGNHDNATLEIQEVAKKMEEAVKSQAENLPDSCSLSAITRDKDRGLFKKADEVLTRYPSEIMNGFFALSGMAIATAAVRHGVLSKPELLAGLSAKDAKSRVNSAYMDIGVGLLNVAAGGVAALITEKAHDPDAPKKHGIDWIWEKIQEKPLAISGIGLMMSTCLHAVSSYKEYRVAKANNDKMMLESVPFRAGFVACSLIAELLIAVSSKGHGDGVVMDKSTNESIVALAADLIVKQPVEQREHLVDYLAGFLGRDDVLAMKDSAVRDMLQKQVAVMDNNPWAQCHHDIKVEAQPEIAKPIRNIKINPANFLKPPIAESPYMQM